MKAYRRTQFIYVVLLIFSIITMISNSIESKIPDYVTYIGVFIFALSICLIAISRYSFAASKKNAYLEDKMKLWNSISYRVKGAGEVSFNDMPIGIIVFNDKMEIDWSNNYAKTIFSSSLVERKIVNINKELYNHVLRQETVFRIEIYGKIYEVTNIVKDDVLYFTDVTEAVHTKQLYQNRILALGIVNLDNMSVSLASFDAKERAMQISNLIGILTAWAEKNNIAIKGYSEDRYLIILDYQTLEDQMKNNFDILNDIKDYCTKEGIRLTASIGIACKDIDADMLMEESTQQLQLALNRGGNQAVVKINDNVTYYGGKSEAFEVRTPVYIRIKTEELCDLIIKASNVCIMTHTDMDADAFGSCLAIRKLVQSLDKEAKILFDEDKIDETVTTIYNTIKQKHINLLDALYTSKEALSNIDEDTLLIIVDCQYQNLLMNEKMLKRINKVAIIDHHRRNTTAISDFIFLYTQPSASSSVELIIEMMGYIDEEKIDISAIEATWMLMGVIVDTNNLMYRTTHRTFNILAKLQSYGADMAKVQRYLRENFSEYVKKIAILNNIEIMEGGYGIAVCDNDIYSRAFLAKIADNIIYVSNIVIAFCIGKIGPDVVGISARSLDEANVQVIMEKMGGGGHFNNAATQISNVTIEEAKEMLIKVMKDNFGEGEKSMKVILTKDVKGKGKVNDIIDIPTGHAIYLIRSNKAIEATTDNIKQLEQNQIKEQQKADEYLEDMRELKKKLENLSVKVKVKVGKSGKLFGSVSTKTIVDEFKNQNNIELDKRKIISESTIEALGTYKIPIQLHKEVTGIITLHVIEEGK